MSHVQNLQHAVVAAKAGNPSLARVHLHKAAEEAPDDPAVWLWMGWLAESPISMIQCLETAMQDERHHNVAQAGLAFAHALSSYQVGGATETATTTAAQAAPEAQAAQVQSDAAPGGPVEVIEQLEAQVASVQETTTPSVPNWDNAGQQVTSVPTQAAGWDPNGQTPPPLPAEAVPQTQPVTGQSAEPVTTHVAPSPPPAQVQPEIQTHPFNAPSPQPAAAPQSTAGTPTPVWRAASSDWFTVDGTKNASTPQPELSHGMPAFVAAQETAGVANTDGSVGGSEAVVPDEPHQLPTETECLVQPTPAEQLDAELERRHVDVVLESPAVSPQPASRTVQTEQQPNLTAKAPADRTQLEPWKPSGFTERELQPYEAQGVTSSPSGPAAMDGTDPGSFSGPSFEGEPLKPATHPRTVLVVDDSPTVRKLVAMTLEKNGYRVVSAFDGVAAIKEIAEHNPVLILMDVNMPRMDGYQLCKLVRKHEATRHIPVLMLSGQDGMFDRIRGKMVGCSGYVPKPFVPEELVKAVGEQLGVSAH